MADRTILLAQNKRHATRGLSVVNPQEFLAYQEDDDNLTYIVDMGAYLDGATIVLVTRTPTGVVISNASNTTTRLTQRLAGYGHVDFRVQTSAGDTEQFRVYIQPRAANPAFFLTAGSGGGITALDGDKGDVIVSSAGSTWTLDPTAVASLNVFTDTLKGITPASGGGTSNFLRADGTWATPPGGGGTITLTGDVTGSGTGSFATAIGAGVIVNADVNASAAIDATKLSFTQAGTGAVVRTIDSKLKDVVSVADFGASPSASAATNTAAIQAAIDAHPGETIFFPPGAYAINNTLRISSNHTHLLGAERNGVYIQMSSTTLDIIHIAPSTPNQAGQSVSGVRIENLVVQRTTANATAGAGVHIQQGSGIRLWNVSGFDNFYDFWVEGSQNIEYFYCNSLTSQVSLAKTGSVGFRIDGLTLSDSSWRAGFTHRFVNTISSDSQFWRDSLIYIGAVDYLIFQGGYLGASRKHLVVRPSVNNNGIYNLQFNNVYFDGVTLDANSTNVAVDLDNNGKTSSPIDFVHFNGCILAQVKTALKVANGNDVGAVEFNDCDFHNIREVGMDVVTSANTGPRIRMIGGRVNVFNQANGSHDFIKVNGGKELSVVGASFETVNAADAIDVQNCASVIVTSNNFVGVSAEVVSSNITRSVVANNLTGRTLSTLELSTTRLGNSALASTSLTGTHNTGIGYQAASAITSGVGIVAVGAGAAKNLTTSSSSTAVGYDALENNTTGANNTAIGFNALRYFNTSNNVAVGFEAMRGGDTVTIANNTATETTAIGRRALRLLTTGAQNTAVGFQALAETTTGADNMGVGAFALSLNTTGSGNSGIGALALGVNETGSWNTAIGRFALRRNTTGVASTAIGSEALERFVASRNTAIGYQALYGGDATPANNTGNDNIAIGYRAGDAITTGSTNIVIGYDLDVDSATGNNQINIGGVYFHDRFLYTERADPAAPAANRAVVYARDNGSGKTQLCVRFNTGAVQVLATEP